MSNNGDRIDDRMASYSSKGPSAYDHDCIGPVGFIAAIHASFSQPNTLIQESVRAFYRGWYLELVTEMPRIENGYVYPMEAPGLGVDLLPAVYERSDLTVRRSTL